MENENDSLDQTAHAHGITDLEFEEQEAVLAQIGWFDQKVWDDLPTPPPFPKGVRPLPRHESTPQELSEWVADDLEDYWDWIILYFIISPLL